MQLMSKHNLVRLSALLFCLAAASLFYAERTSVKPPEKGAAGPGRPGPAPPAPREMVKIGSRAYEVKAPWLGHRIEGDFDPAGMDLVRLPVELVLEKRNIYVNRAARDAFVRMAEAAARDGIELLVDSGYRSASYQQKIYEKKMAKGDGFYDVARWVAPPGYSEHMTGMTLDLVPSNWAFSDTPADLWLQENGGAYSFTQSYPRHSPAGFAWEPWHWKYTGGS